MAWTTQKPGFIGALADVEGRSETVSGKQMVRAYSRLFTSTADTLPAFKDFDIRDIAQAVPYIALVSVKIGAQCTIRLFGEELRRRAASNPIGKNLREFIHPDRADSVQRMMEMLVGTPCGYLANVKQEFMNGRMIVVETVAFPLRPSRDDEDGQVIMTDTPIKTEGYTFDREKVLLSADVVWRDLIDLGFGVDETFVDVVSDQSGGQEEA